VSGSSSLSVHRRHLIIFCAPALQVTLAAPTLTPGRLAPRGSRALVELLRQSFARTELIESSTRACHALHHQGNTVLKEPLTREFGRPAQQATFVWEAPLLLRPADSVTFQGVT
jgi:hypothetical protein